jgi:hypothetical protein
VSFTTKTEISSLEIKISAKLFGVTIPIKIPVGYENACSFQEGDAIYPIQDNSKLVWALEIPVASFYSGVELNSNEVRKVLNILCN